MGLLDDDDGRINHGADRNSNAAEAHDVGRQSHQIHRDEGDDNRNRYGDNGNKGRGDVPEEDHDHDADNNQFFKQRIFKCFNRTLDQGGAIIGGNDFDPGRKRSLHLSKFFSDSFNNLERVLSKTHDDDATHNLPFSIEVSNPPPDVRAQPNHSEILHEYRSPARSTGAHDDVFDIG